MYENDGMNQYVSNKILSYMKNATTVKKAKFAKKQIASLTNECTGNKIGIKKARLIFKKMIRRALQLRYKDEFKFKEFKFIDIENKLVNA